MNTEQFISEIRDSFPLPAPESFATALNSLGQVPRAYSDFLACRNGGWFYREMRCELESNPFDIDYVTDPRFLGVGAAEWEDAHEASTDLLKFAIRTKTLIPSNCIPIAWNDEGLLLLHLKTGSVSFFINEGEASLPRRKTNSPLRSLLKIL